MKSEEPPTLLKNLQRSSRHQYKCSLLICQVINMSFILNLGHFILIWITCRARYSHFSQSKCVYKDCIRMSRCRKSIPWSLNTPIRLESQIKMKRGVCDFNGYTIIKLGRILHRVDTFHDVVHNAQFVRIQYFFHSVNQQNYC